MSLKLHILASTPSLLSFQDAFLSFGHNISDKSSVNVFSDGCILSDGKNNCQLACQNASLIFESTATLQNCLQYPALIAALSHQDLDPESVSAAADFGFFPENVGVSNNIATIIQQCLNEYCASPSGQCDAQASRSSAEVPATLCSTTQPHLCFKNTNICDSVYAPVVDDIAGIGIYASYWMQNGIALVAFALLRLFDFWIYYITIALLFCFSGFKKAKAKAETAKQMGLRYRVPNLISALIEFQKAQCFFMIAVQAAAIIVVRGGGFQAQTLQQLSNTYSAITLISICGFLPVVLTLVSLHGVGKSSWYIIALSVISVVLSGVTAFTSRHFNPSPNDLKFLRDASGGPASCGNKDPTTFCLSSSTVDPFEYPGGVKHTFIYCIIILFFLILDKSRNSRILSRAKNKLLDHDSLQSRKPTPQKQKSRFTVLARLSTTPSYLSNLEPSTKKRLGNLLYGCVWIVFLFFYCRCVFLLSRWINHQIGVIGPSTWTFGQIVGITVWLPSLIQYLYLETRGMEAWFDQHIAGDHRIVQHNPPSDPESDYHANRSSRQAVQKTS